MIAAVCFSLAGPIVAHAGEYQPAPPSGSREFERLKQLVGVWEGTSDMGKEGEKVRVEYNDHIIQKWTLFEKGKDKGGVTLKLTRVN